MQLLSGVGHKAGVDHDVRGPRARSDRERNDLVDVALVIERRVDVPALVEQAQLEPGFRLELALRLQSEGWHGGRKAVEGNAAVPGAEAVDVVGDIPRGT